MKQLLLSIKPKWAEAIRSDGKTIEVRKNIPRQFLELPREWSPAGVVYPCHFFINFYETSPVAKITGWGIVNAIFDLRRCSPDQLERLLKRAKLDFKSYMAYVGTDGPAYGYALRDYHAYEPPLSLAEIDIFRAPQSWRYIISRKLNTKKQITNQH